MAASLNNVPVGPNLFGQKLLQQREFSHEPDILKRIYLNRQISNLDEVKLELSGLLHFETLLHIQKVSEIIGEGIKHQKRFLILGDFDTDGATSTALAVSALKAFGAEQVDYLIPNRFEYGYGLTPEIVDVAAARKPDILITVDNGISNHAGVARAKQYGIVVIITDHHLAGDTLPGADVIVNPNQPEDSFQSKNLAGVGVIFYVMLAVRQYLQCKVNMSQFLDLVALGTVADVVKLDKNNRILVHHGIQRIRLRLARPGIMALLTISKKNPLTLKSSDLGFSIGPRLNAAGRLEDMSLGVSCLLSPTIQAAFKLAVELDSLNQARRDIQADMLEQADILLENIKLDNIPNCICIYHPDFHQGVIGIIAGRLKDRYHRPVFVFANSEEGIVKASARSIPGLHLRDSLALLDTKYPGMLTKFGGHAMAAGLTLDHTNLEGFNTKINDIIEYYISNQIIDKNLFNPVLLTDGELLASDMNILTASLLRCHSPWGQGFPEPLFEGKFKIIDQKLLNQKHLKLILQVYTENSINNNIEAIAFNQGELINNSIITIAYRLDVNYFNNTEKVQLIIEHLK